MRYVGDAVALVVADTEDLAMEAMDKIKVEYEQLEPVYTIDEAMKPGAPPRRAVLNMDSHAWDLHQEGIM